MPLINLDPLVVVSKAFITGLPLLPGDPGVPRVDLTEAGLLGPPSKLLSRPEANTDSAISRARFPLSAIAGADGTSVRPGGSRERARASCDSGAASPEFVNGLVAVASHGEVRSDGLLPPVENESESCRRDSERLLLRNISRALSTSRGMPWAAPRTGWPMQSTGPTTPDEDAFADAMSNNVMEDCEFDLRNRSSLRGAAVSGDADPDSWALKNEFLVVMGGNSGDSTPRLAAAVSWDRGDDEKVSLSSRCSLSRGASPSSSSHGVIVDAC